MAQSKVVTDPAKLPAWRVLLIFLIFFLLIALLVREAVLPIQRQLARRYLSRGDSFLASQQFEQAEQEYQKALANDPQLTVADQHLKLAKIAPTDIAQARDFYAEEGVKRVVEQIDAAEKTYSNPKDALAAGVILYNQGQFPYAQYPLQKAVALDPKYPEAWHYLFLTYSELAKLNAEYREKATDAKNHRDALTPRYLKLEIPGVK